MREPAINIGDKFVKVVNGDIVEVLEDHKFGKVDLFCKKKCYFQAETKKRLRSKLYSRLVEQ